MNKVNDSTGVIANYVSPEVKTIILELEQSILDGSSDPSGSTDPWEDVN